MGFVSLGMTAFLVLGQAGGPSGTRVAIVDLPAISSRYLKTADLEAQFEQYRIQYNEKREALRQQIERAGRSLQEELKPGTELFEQRRKELAMLEAEQQWFTEAEGQKIEASLARSLRGIYDDIKIVVTEIANERGIDVVLAADQLPSEGPATTAAVRQQIMLQKVIYWNPQVEITNEVVTRLNARYQSTKRVAAPGAARPPLSDPIHPGQGDPPGMPRPAGSR